MSASTRRAALGAILAAPLATASAASSPPVAGEEYADLRVRLLAAYAEDRACRPLISTGDPGTVEYEAAVLVTQRCMALAEEAATLPAPHTLDGLALAALGAVVHWEASHSEAVNDQAAIGLIRAVLAFTDTALPPGFVGFGDEPDHMERDRALYRGAASLPAWALAEAEICA